jgi:hypothetical protein
LPEHGLAKDDGLAGSRRRRRRLGRQRLSRLRRRQALAGALSLLVLLLPAALATPRRSDETALLVVCGWLLTALVPTLREGRPPGIPSLRRRGRVAPAKGFLVAAGYAAGGLAFYALSLARPPLDRAREVVVLGPPRPCIAVASEDNPFILARVVRVNPDLSLVIDEGEGVWGERTGERARGGEVVWLAGVQRRDDPTIMAAAVRLLTEQALGRVVTIRAVAVAGGKLVALVMPEIAPSLAPTEAVLNEILEEMLNAQPIAPIQGP